MHLKDNLAISDSGFIFHPETGESFSVNEQGREIIDLIRDGKPYKDILEFVLSKYDVTETVFEKDYQDFVLLLNKFQFIRHGEEED